MISDNYKAEHPFADPLRCEWQSLRQRCGHEDQKNTEDKIKVSSVSALPTE